MSPKLRPRKYEKKQDEQPYAQNKKAFDDVLIYFRRMDRPLLAAAGAVNPEKAAKDGSGVPRLRNLPLDFWCDVTRVFTDTLPRGVSLTNFFLAYFVYDSEDEIERNKHAIRVLGGRAHSVEQRLGAEFVRRGIWPVGQYLKVRS